MAIKMWMRVKFGQSAFLGGGKIVNTPDQADMFRDSQAAVQGISDWRESLGDVPPNTEVEFSLDFVAVLNVAEDAVDPVPLTDASEDNRG